MNNNKYKIFGKFLICVALTYTHMCSTNKSLQPAGKW